MVNIFTWFLFAMLALMLTATSALAEQTEYAMPSPPEVEWQDSAGTTYTTIGSLQLEQITQDKLESCLKASGNNKFCQCLTGKLPVGLTFVGYIQSVTKSRQNLGYAEFSDNEKMMIDMALSVRNQCVPETSAMLALVDEDIQARTRPEKPRMAPAPARSEDKTSGPAVDQARASSSKPASRRSYLVQVASYKHPEDAEAMKSRLANYGLEAHTKAVDLPQRGRWHRVYLGPYAKRDMAEQAKGKVHDHLKLSALLVRGKL